MPSGRSRCCATTPSTTGASSATSPPPSSRATCSFFPRRLHSLSRRLHSSAALPEPFAAADALESGGGAVIVGAANGSAGPEAIRPARPALNLKRAIIQDWLAAAGYPGGAGPEGVRAQREATHEVATAW